MATLSIRTFIDEAIESIINGNMGKVIEEIGSLPKKQAICAVAYIVDSLHSGRGIGYLSSFLRRLEAKI
jgi:hypothetical protein